MIAARISVPPRTSAGSEHQSKSDTAKEGTDDDRHERLVVQDRLAVEQLFEQPQGTGQREDAEDGLDQKLESQHFQCDQQQYDVDREVRERNGNESFGSKRISMRTHRSSRRSQSDWTEWKPLG